MQNDAKDQYVQKKDRKALLGIGLFILAIIMLIGAGFSYFSDILLGEGSAEAGTLDITGDIALEVNGTTVTATDNKIENLNPGDVITFDITGVQNTGTKSAWIRQAVKFTAMSDTDNTEAAGDSTGNLVGVIWVCLGNVTQAQLIAASQLTGGLAANPIADVACSVVPATYVNSDPSKATAIGLKTDYSAPIDVISGSEESDGSGLTWAPSEKMTIFFDATAGNTAQLGTMSFRLEIQALQYRNNTAPPTTDQWSTVVTQEFSV